MKILYTRVGFIAYITHEMCELIVFRRRLLPTCSGHYSIFFNFFNREITSCCALRLKTEIARDHRRRYGGISPESTTAVGHVRTRYLHKINVLVSIFFCFTQLHIRLYGTPLRWRKTWNRVINKVL